MIVKERKNFKKGDYSEHAVIQMVGPILNELKPKWTMVDLRPLGLEVQRQLKTKRLTREEIIELAKNQIEVRRIMNIK